MIFNTENWYDLIEEFIETVGGNWTRTTLLWYRRQLGKFAEFTEARKIKPRKLTAADLNRFQGWLRSERYAYSTRENTVGSVKSLLSWCVRARKIKFNPFDDPDYRPLKKERTIVEPIPLHVAREMIRAAEADKSVHGIRDAAIMRLLLTTGIRREELTTLQFVSVHLETPAHVVVTGKFGHQRPLPLKITTVAAIRLWLEHRPKTFDQAIFITLANDRYGTYHQMRPKAVNELLSRWRERAGVPAYTSVSPHKWRHLFATVMSQHCDEFHLQALMGHQDIATTSEYVQRLPNVIVQRVIDFAPDVE